MRYFLIIILSSITVCMAGPEKSIEHFQASFRFQNFMGFSGKGLQAFQEKYIPKVEGVFYPFGGPDLLHPLFLFPDASTYVLVGLEPSGAPLSPETYTATFDNLDTFLRGGFFVTANMGKKFNKETGARAALAFQVLLAGGTVIDDLMVDPKTACISFEWKGKKKTGPPHENF